MDATRRLGQPQPGAAVGNEVATGRGNCIGRYVILEEIGAGGMGVVFKAYDPELRREVALKLLRTWADAPSEEARSRLLREAQAAARLAHPNVVTVYDAGRHGDEVFLAMEMVEGVTLREWLRTRSRSWREVVQVFLDAGRGLAAAHAGGLVHRDFKPENVLIGGDGRPRVADFGLAREIVAEIARPEADDEVPNRKAHPAGGGLPSANLTRPGAKLGTPAYMAPEQHAGRDAGQPADQFSFCAALYEALYGERPFAGDTNDDLAAEVLAGRVREAPQRPRVPAGLRRALLRGLSVEPRERHASMDSLLEALSRVLWWRRRRLWAAALVVLLGMGMVLGLLSRPTALCQDARRHLVGIWDQERQQAAAAAFRKSGLPFAGDAFRRVRVLLNGFGDRWVRAHAEACEATRIRGEHSERMLDLKMTCLAARKKELRALTDLMVSADSAVVRGSVQAAFRLPEIAPCNDVATLGKRIPPPADPRIRASVDAARSRLAAAKAFSDTGLYAGALGIAKTVVATATKLGYCPLEAEARFRLGDLLDRTSRVRESEQNLRQAVLAAQRCGHDEVAARSRVALVWVVGYQGGGAPAAERHGEHAAALISRIGGHAPLEARLHDNLGSVLRMAQRLPEALAHHRKAIAIRQKALGPNHPHVAVALNNAALVLARLNKGDEGLAYLRRAVSLLEATLGRRHPHFASALHNLALACARAGRHEEAERHLRRSMGIYRETPGEVSTDFARALGSLATIRLARGKDAEAVALSRKALRLWERLLGSGHRGIVSPLHDLGISLYYAGHSSEAVATLRRAVALGERVFGSSHARLRNPLSSLGEALVEQGHPRLALPLLSRALRISTRILPPDHPSLANPLTGLGEALLGLRRPKEALRSLRRAEALIGRGPASALDAARLQFALARALWHVGRDRRRALREARNALAAYGKSRIAFARRKHRQVEGWLRRR